MGMFDNYNNQLSTYIPNNRVDLIHWVRKDYDELVPGATCIHVFKVDINFTRDATDLEIFYKQGISIVLTKGIDDVAIAIDDDLEHSYISISLSPEETSLFNDYNKDLVVQIKVTLTDDSIIYSNVYPLKLKEVLEK